MKPRPTTDDLIAALNAASAAHHDYEANALKGQYDEQWPGWFAAYVLGRLGDFVTPTTLAEWLAGVQGEGDWSINAAEVVTEHLKNS